MDGTYPSESVPGVFLKVRAGLPFRRRVRLTDGKLTFWDNLSLFEARMQIRVDKDSRSRLKYDFTPHLATAFDANDILVSWNLSGAETLELKGGYFDLILSDIGTTDETAIPILWGTIDVTPIVTSLVGV